MYCIPEKAANCINPGQEVHPSGYAEFIESHQDRPWESLSCVPASVKSALFTEHPKSTANVMYDYGLPYDGIPQPTITDIGKVADFIPVSSMSSDGHSNTTRYTNQGSIYDGSFDSYSQIKSDVIKKESHVHMKPQMENQRLREELRSTSNQPTYTITYDEQTNGSIYTTNMPYVEHNGSLSPDQTKPLKKSIKASQVTAVQTDALTPRTQKQFDMLEFPKTDIIVEGHDKNETHLLQISPKSIPVDGVSSNNETMDQHSSVDSEITNLAYANSQKNVGQSYDQPMETGQSFSNTCDNYEQKDLDTATASDYVPKQDHTITEPDLTSMSFSKQENDTMVEERIHIGSRNQPEGNKLSRNTTQNDVVGFGTDDSEITETEIEDYLARHEDLPVTKYCNSEKVSDGKDNPDILMDVDQTQTKIVDNESSIQNVERTSPSVLMNSIQDHSSELSASKTESLAVKTVLNDVTDNSNRFHDFGLNIVDSSAPAISEKEQVFEHFEDGNTLSSVKLLCEQNITDVCSEMMNPEMSNSAPQVTGIGARPKEPMQVKKNRPNSLLGLSKINLDSPFNMSQPVHERADGGNQSSCSSRESFGFTQSEMSSVDGNQNPDHSLETTAGDIGGSKLSGKKWISPQQKKMINLEIKQQIAQEQRQRMDNYVFDLGQEAGPPHPAITDTGFPYQLGTDNVLESKPQTLSSECGLGILPGPVDSQQAAGSLESSLSSGIMDMLAVGDSNILPNFNMENISADTQISEDIAVLRRSEDVPASLGYSGMSRPHSWSPGGSEQAVMPQKLKRPTSLNLPQRQDFNLNVDKSPENATSKHRRVGMMPSSEIPEESEPSGMTLLFSNMFQVFVWNYFSLILKKLLLFIYF